jgi:hypothetical protein
MLCVLAADPDEEISATPQTGHGVAQPPGRHRSSGRQRGRGHLTPARLHRKTGQFADSGLRNSPCWFHDDLAPCSAALASALLSAAAFGLGCPRTSLRCWRSEKEPLSTGARLLDLADQYSLADNSLLRSGLGLTSQVANARGVPNFIPKTLWLCILIRALGSLARMCG